MRTSSLFVRGYLPQSALILPEWGEFDVGAYSKFQQTVTELQSAVLFDNDNIRPQLLATTMPESGGTAQDALGRPDNADLDVRAEETHPPVGPSDSQNPSLARRLLGVR